MYFNLHGFKIFWKVADHVFLRSPFAVFEGPLVALPEHDDGEADGEDDDEDDDDDDDEEEGEDDDEEVESK